MDDMSLVYNINLCRICQIPKNLDLIDTITIQKKGQTYLELLKFIFTDITWIEDQLLSLACHNCITKIKDIAEFKHVCIESNNRRATLNVDLIKFEVEEVEIDEIPELKDVLDDYDHSLSEPEETEQWRSKDGTCKRKHSDDSVDEPLAKRVNYENARSDCTTMLLRTRKNITKYSQDSQEEINSKKVGSFECPICHIFFERTRNLDRHVFKHTGIRSYVCKDCDAKYITDYDLKKHKRSHCKNATADKDRIDIARETRKRGPKSKKKRFVCKICNMVFEGTKPLERHMYKHNGIRNYSCDGCGVKFITGDDLKHHIQHYCNKDKPGKKRGPKPKPPRFVCDICQKRFEALKPLERHLYRHNGTRNYTCNGCRTKFITGDDLKCHLLHHCNGIKKDKVGITGNHISRVRKYSCDLCPTPVDFDRLTNLERHLYQHNGVRKYTCNGCGTKFITREDLKGHLRRHCTEEKLSCFLCPDKQFTPLTLEVHMKMIHMVGIDGNTPATHQTEKEQDGNHDDDCPEVEVGDKKNEGDKKPKAGRSFKCQYCPMEFTRLKYLDRHVYNHDGTRNYICNDCGTRSITIDNLRSHMTVVHANREDFKFLCTECGARFPQSSGLKLHVRRVHSNIRNFTCEICNKAFCEKRDLNNHMTSHSDAREFKCDLCPAQYKRKDVLLIHKTKRHGIGNYKCQDEKKHKCNFCDKKFNVREKLNRHIRSHTGVKPFKCRLCDMKFVCKSYIKSHVMSKHSDLVDGHDFEVNAYCEVLEDLVTTNASMSLKVK